MLSLQVSTPSISERPYVQKHSSQLSPKNHIHFKQINQSQSRTIPNYPCWNCFYLHVGVFIPELIYPREILNSSFEDISSMVNKLMSHLHLHVLQPNRNILIIYLQCSLVNTSRSSKLLEAFFKNCISKWKVWKISQKYSDEKRTKQHKCYYWLNHHLAQYPYLIQCPMWKRWWRILFSNSFLFLCLISFRSSSSLIL